MDAKVREIARRHQGTLTDVQYLGLVSALEEMQNQMIDKAESILEQLLKGQGWLSSAQFNGFMQSFKNMMEE